MILILVLWGIINLAALLIFVEYIKNTDCWLNYFVYPWIGEWLDRERIGPFGKWFMFVMITIFFLPAFAVYYAVFTIYILFVLIIYLLAEWRRRRKQNRQK
jgi:hypothetical protein